MTMIEIDGSFGEGGGQVLRTSLALSMITQTPVHLRKIRAGRHKDGLLRQHLTGVLAAAEICGATVQGAELRSTEVVFEPGPVVAGEYSFAVGTAGSANLVLQTILPALAAADGPSTVTVRGGTHNPKSPSTTFLTQTFAPALAAFGPQLDLELQDWGFFPAGGGCLQARIHPAPWRAADIGDRGEIRSMTVHSIVSHDSRGAARRRASAVGASLDLPKQDWHSTVVKSIGPGAVVWVQAVTEAGVMVFMHVPQRRGKKTAAPDLTREVDRWERSGVFVDEHLADQLLIPMALAGGGSIRTLAPSLHTTTNCTVISRFLPVDFEITEQGPDLVHIQAHRRS